MISCLIRKAYFDLAAATRTVMVNDFETQYSIRSEIRKVIREQLPLMKEESLLNEIKTTTSMLITSVVQARWNENTGAHKLIVRPEMLKTDGSVSELNFLSPEEVLGQLNGTIVEDFDKAVGCKTKKSRTN